MYTTSPSLLEKLRQPNPVEAWARFIDLYTPLFYFWARKLCSTQSDANDLVQDVFVKLLIELPKFSYDATGSFRGWLRTVCMRHWKDTQNKRASQPVQASAADLNTLPASDDWEAFWKQEYAALIVQQAFRIMSADFDATTRTIIEEVVMKGRRVEDVARELGLSPNAVSSRKRRVLAKLRQELRGCLD